MRIFILNNLFPPYARGGAESVVVVQARQLRDAGHEVHVITVAPLLTLGGFSLERVSNEQGITVHQYAPLNIWSYVSLGKLPWWLRLVWHGIDLVEPYGYFLLRKLIRNLQPDLVYSHNVKGMGMRIIRACRFAKQHIHVLHDVQLITPSGLIYYGQEKSWEVQGRMAQWYRAMCQRVFKDVKEVIGPTDWIIHFHKQFGFFEKAICRKQTLIDAPRPFLQDRDAEYRRSFRNGRVAPTRFLFVGQVEKHKGVEFLLSVFSDLAVEDSSLHLDVVGDGSLLSLLKEKFASHPWVTFHGRLHSDQLSVLYKKSDVLLVPSLCYENAPNVIQEAHQHGLTVYASAIGGIPELLQSSDTAIAPGDSSLWKKALKQGD